MIILLQNVKNGGMSGLKQSQCLKGISDDSFLSIWEVLTLGSSFQVIVEAMSISRPRLCAQDILYIIPKWQIIVYS